MSLFRNASSTFSIGEIKDCYPDEWVALSVLETDADGFAAKGEILAHDADERFVWSALKLGNADDLVYVFFTGARHDQRPGVKAAAPEGVTGAFARFIVCANFNPLRFGEDRTPSSPPSAEPIAHRLLFRFQGEARK